MVKSEYFYLKIQIKKGCLLLLLIQHSTGISSQISKIRKGNKALQIRKEEVNCRFLHDTVVPIGDAK